MKLFDTIVHPKETKTLTGNYYYKSTISGLILIVEEQTVETVTDLTEYKTTVAFRKADYSDLFILNLVAIPK